MKKNAKVTLLAVGLAAGVAAVIARWKWEKSRETGRKQR